MPSGSGAGHPIYSPCSNTPNATQEAPRPFTEISSAEESSSPRFPGCSRLECFRNWTLASLQICRCLPSLDCLRARLECTQYICTLYTVSRSGSQKHRTVLSTCFGGSSENATFSGANGSIPVGNARDPRNGLTVVLCITPESHMAVDSASPLSSPRETYTSHQLDANPLGRPTTCPAEFLPPFRHQRTSLFRKCRLEIGQIDHCPAPCGSAFWETCDSP